MAAIYTGGQVSAKVVLNTKEFDSAIERVSKRMEEFNKSLNSAGADNFSDKIANLEQRLNTAKQTIVTLAEKVTDYKKRLDETKNSHKSFENSVNSLSNSSNKYKTQLKQLATALKDYKNNVANANQANAQFKGQLMGLANAIKTTESSHKAYSTSMKEVHNGLRQVTSGFQQQKYWLNYIHTGYNRITQSIIKTTDVLKTFNFALLDGVDKEGIFYNRTIQLASAMQRMNSQGTANWSGRGQFGYSQYISQINQMNQALNRQKQIESTIKAQRLDQYYAKVGSASAKYWNQIRQGTINLNTYKSQMNQINSILSQQTSRTQKLASAQYKLFQQYHTTNLNTYKANMNEINAQLEKQQANFSKTNTNARNAGRGLTSFNNGVVQTAHSGRILSNTLYQIRGALLSLKMIFTAMGGMMLWGFAMDIAEGVKETLTAKNEMEAQLRQNSKVGEGGIAYFNKELEKTTKLFPKINKYSIGETVSSIGLEFNLNAKQMAESLDIVSMVQSEYVRAGRKEAEAALAVKDILQGEFSRLSRETGVGKEELIAYGWSGKKDDVESLMKALRKAAKDRHWDVFAAKATSLNDVMTILKSRFSETGADILNSATPLIVGAFNTIIGAIDSVQKAFNGLNSFWQNFTLFGGALSGILAIGTALPMVTKGMGLADIATIGWGKSILTAALNLNKAEVAQYGFRKALAAVITGEKASEIATVSSTKAILGRLLGVNQTIMKQEGLASALIASRAALKGESEVMALTAASSMNLRQKLTYLVGNISLADAKTAGWGKTLKALVTSTKLLKIALAGLMAVGVIAWLSSIAAWCDKVKGYVDAFNDVAENGTQILADAETTVSDYETALSKLTKGTDEYAQAEANLSQARANRDDIKQANELMGTYKKQNEETEKAIKLRHQSALKDSYILAGKDYKAATELASGYSEKVRVGQYYINKSWEEYDKRIYRASQHINEHVGELKAAGASQEDMIRYIDEYNIEAENAAELWKKFNQGDMASGAYAMLSELKLAWIDISHHPEVVKLFHNLGETWKGLQPTLKSITEDLKWLGLRLVDFGNWLMSNDLGKAVVTWGAFGTVVGAVALKVGKWVTGSKSTIEVLKTLGGKLKDRIKDWRNYGDEAEKANKKAGGGVTSTGGINGDVTKSGGSFKEQLGTQLKADATKYARAAVAIAAGMLLITEAIVLLRAPMGALAELGWQFKQWEPEIKKGIEGLRLIAPTVVSLLIPIMALVKVMDMWGGQILNWKTLGGTAVGIAAGMLFVAEAIFMLRAPMWSLSQVGKDYAIGKKDIEGGITAIKTLTEALEAMLPVVPIFLAGIALGVTIFMAPEIGLLIAGGAAVGIAAGMLLVAEAVVTLRMPLEAIRELGNSFTDIEGARKGAEAIKLTAEAMTYVEEATRAMTLVKWELIGSWVADLIGRTINIDLTSLTNEGGFFDQLNTFLTDFAKVEIVPVDPGKVEALSVAGDSISSIGDSMQKVDEAMQKLPEVFKNGGTNSPITGYNSETGQKMATDTDSYFSQLKEPIEQLNNFMKQFNEMEVTNPDMSKVTAITQSASMIEQIKFAVDNVKSTMGGIADSSWNTNMATGGIGAAVSGFLFGTGGGVGNYSSSIGQSLNEMYKVIKDIMQFNSDVAALTAEGGTDVSGITGSITVVDSTIQSLMDTLTQAASDASAKGKAIGSNLANGMKEGMSGMGTIVTYQVTTAIDAAKPYAYTYGKGLGGRGKSGFQEEFKIKDAVSTELGYALTEMENKKQDFYDKGYALGDAAAKGFKDGEDSHSPGIIARTMFDEMAYVEQSLDDAIETIPAKSYDLGNALATNFTPQFATDFGLTDMTNFETGLNTISYTAQDTNLQTSNAFTNMNTTVGTSMQGMTNSVTGSFTNIKQNATTSYTQLVNTTRTSLNNMQSQTTKNINAIKTSWKGMQNALIASAENIRSQTSQKINNLQSNMASFWRKVQNPALLLGAGSEQETHHTIRRRGMPKISTSGIKGKLAAGSSRLGAKSTGISNRFRPKTVNNKQGVLDRLADYLECLKRDGYCAAGGWNFNWSQDIKNALMKWHTHFGEIYDPHLYVGKFENDDFPVRGIAAIAKNYIYDAISRTAYEHYYNYKYGSPLAAWNAGKFNCVEGASVAIALANSFGFGGGSIQYGTWDGEGHGFAVIPGLGVIDATAIQRGYGFRSPKVSGYPAAGSSGSSRPPKLGDTNNYNGDINIHIHTDGNNVEVDDSKIDNETGRKIIDLLGINPSTGR